MVFKRDTDTSYSKALLILIWRLSSLTARAQNNFRARFQPQHACILIGSYFSLCLNFLFLQHFDVIYDLLLNRRTVTWNLFVK